MAKAKAGTKATPAISVPFATLRGLLGKTVDDPAVQEVVARAGKVKVSSEFIVAKEAGFDFGLAQPAGAKRNAKKVLSTLFLFPEGADDHRGFADLPGGLAFSSRDELRATMPRPARSWQIGTGEVDPGAAGASSDRWLIDGLELNVSYGRTDGRVRHITASLPANATGGERLATHPLHFQTRPPDAPPDAERVGMALLVAWAADRFGLPPRHAGTELGEQLIAHAITPRDFLIRACGGTLTTLDFVPQLATFLGVYTQNVHSDDGGARDAANAKIAALLGLARPGQNFGDDFLATFAGVVESPFYVPDSWEAVARITPVIDARLADFEVTRFRTAPNLKLYDRAVKARDAWTVTPARATLASVSVADATLADDLIALIGRPLTDKQVKAVLGRANLPVGKRIDQQANPALGVAYMGTKLEIDGKKQLGVDAVWFYAAGVTHYIRGIGAEVKFAAYPGPLPRGLAWGMSRAACAEQLGSRDDRDAYRLDDRRTLGLVFDDDKLVEVQVSQRPLT